MFVEDTKANNVLGKIVKIDTDYVLVKMQAQTTDNNNESNADNSSNQDVLENSRIYQKSQLQLVRHSSTGTGSSSSSSSSVQMPDFHQKSLKKLSDMGDVFTISAQLNFVHAVVHKENALFYVQYDLFSNKLIREKRISSSVPAFIGHNVNNISLFSIDDQNVSHLVLFFY